MTAWPTGPIEYGSFSWLRREVSQKLGLPADPRLLDHVDRNRVDSIIESGVLRFYYPAPSQFTIPDATEAQKERLRKAPNQWSFLQSSTTITTAIGQSAYTLPASFANFIDEPTTSRDGGRIAIVSDMYLRQLIDAEGTAGLPRYAAVQVAGSDGAARQTHNLYLYPVPGSVETITVRHGIRPPAISSGAPYPLGGIQHAETILAACLLVAVERAGGDLNTAALLFQDRITASIILDSQLALSSSEGVWPVDEPDDGLSINRQYLGKLIGREAGFGPNRHLWTHSQASVVTEAIKSGLRYFYNPPTLPGEAYPHDWSFLSPVTSLVTVAEQSEYDLPANFAILKGDFTYSDDSYTFRSLVRTVGEETIRQHQARQVSVLGRPTMAAVKPKTVGAEIESRYSVLLWPTPDDEFTLGYRYRINPMMLVAEAGDSVVVGASQPEGGPVHAQTIIESCLLALDSLMKINNPVRRDKFMQCLVASVGFDLKLNAPTTLGYNADHERSELTTGRYTSDRTISYGDYTP